MTCSHQLLNPCCATAVSQAAEPCRAPLGARAERLGLGLLPTPWWAMEAELVLVLGLEFGLCLGAGSW